MESELEDTGVRQRRKIKRGRNKENCKKRKKKKKKRKKSVFAN